MVSTRLQPRRIPKALPTSLLQRISQSSSSSSLDVTRKKLSSVRHPTPTEEASCSCATCGSTCCDMV